MKNVPLFTKASPAQTIPKMYYKNKLFAVAGRLWQCLMIMLFFFTAIAKHTAHSEASMATYHKAHRSCLYNLSLHHKHMTEECKCHHDNETLSNCTGSQAHS